MRSLLLLLSTFVVLTGCTPMQFALSTSNDPALESFKVKGRQGWLMNQKLTFGGYQTSPVSARGPGAEIREWVFLCATFTTFIILISFP